MKTILPTLLILLPLVVAAAPAEWKPGAEFLAALAEKDQSKRAGMLLDTAESGVYPADLALIHLTRAAVEPKHAARLRKLAEARRGELIPAVLACRSAEYSDRELFGLALAAWRNASEKRLSKFEAPLFRELSISLVSLCCDTGEYAVLQPRLEEFIRKDRDWRSRVPISALVEFYVSCAFATEGYELPDASWSKAPGEMHQTCARLLDELPKLLTDDPDEMKRLANFFLRAEMRRHALALTITYAERDPDKALPLLVMTAVRLGETKILDSLKKFIRQKAFAEFSIHAAGNAGKFTEAVRALDGITDPERRQALYIDIVNRHGAAALKAKLARDPETPLLPDTRIRWLLGAAERLNDPGCFRDAEKLITAETEADPVMANAFGYVALVLGIDPKTAEARVDRALERNPCNGAYLDSKAYARYVARDYDGAWEWMQKALKVIDPSPTSFEILEHAGDIRLALGDRTRARKFYAAALRLLDRAGPHSGIDELLQCRKRISDKLEMLK